MAERGRRLLRGPVVAAALVAALAVAPPAGRARADGGDADRALAADDASSDAAAAPRPRPLRWSLGAGGGLPLTGSAGPSLDAELELLPGGRAGRFGGFARARASDDGERGLVAAGIIYEAAASRPRLWLELHAEVGVAWGALRPVAGGGIITHLTIIGPLGVVLDSGAHFVYDGVDSELVIASALLLAIAR